MDMQNAVNETKIPKRVLSAILSGMSAGIVPRSGAQYIAIGRRAEIAAMLSDLEKISDGGGAMRFLIGRYGSGKTFLIQLIRMYALEQGFLTADCDLSPERRLSSSSGGGAATYRELMKNFASKASPDGGALGPVLSRWLSGIRSDVAASGLEPDTAPFEDEVRTRIYKTVRNLEGAVGGFDFSAVLHAYYRASLDGDDEKQSAAVRWLRGEFATKTEARAALGFSVGSVITDDNWYDYLKLMALFAREMGYRGLVVFIDECVNLYKITNRVSRESNYEKILSMFNDTLGGRAEGLMIVFGGTPQFLEDTRRGLFSYEALRSRLSEGRFASAEYTNLLSPVISLRRLSDDELLALLLRITKLHSTYYAWNARVSDEEMITFLKNALDRAGGNVMITPREIIRDYMTVLDLLYQNEALTMADLCKSGETPTASEVPAAPEAPTEERRKYTPEDITF